MEVLPTIDALTWIARAGQDILADEKIPMPQLFLKTKSSAFTYEPLAGVSQKRCSTCGMNTGWFRSAKQPSPLRKFARATETCRITW